MDSILKMEIDMTDVILSKNISVFDIAKWFINRTDRAAGDDITQLKLQKLLYYAQAWWLANKNETLFEDDMQAWTHGPVVPSIWQEYKEYGWSSLPPVDGFQFEDAEIEQYLELLYSKYGCHTAKELEELTHKEEPWKITRGNLPLEAKCSKFIDKSIIRDYYSGRISSSKK